VNFFQSPDLARAATGPVESGSSGKAMIRGMPAIPSHIGSNRLNGNVTLNS
jgi:hypothetical protein